MTERNYKKEAEWENKKYKRLYVKLDKEKAERLKQKLNGKPFATWIKERIENYIN